MMPGRADGAACSTLRHATSLRTMKAGAICTMAVLLAFGGMGCAPRENDPAATPLPTRETTIDPVTKKLEAAQQDAERRRSEAERAGQ